MARNGGETARFDPVEAGRSIATRALLDSALTWAAAGAGDPASLLARLQGVSDRAGRIAAQPQNPDAAATAIAAHWQAAKAVVRFARSLRQEGRE